MREYSVSSRSSNSSSSLSSRSRRRRIVVQKSESLFRKQLYILLWKSAVIRLAHPIGTICEFLGPCLFMYLTVSWYNSVNRTSVNNSTNVPPVRFPNPVLEFDLKTKLHPRLTILYAPDDLDGLQELFAKLANPSSLVADFKTLENRLKSSQVDEKSLLVGVYFSQYDKANAQVEYRLLRRSFDDIEVYSKTMVSDENKVVRHLNTDYVTYVKIFAYINSQIVNRFCETKSDHSRLIDRTLIKLNRMPFPGKVSRQQKTSTIPGAKTIGLSIVLIYSLVCPFIVLRLCQEKCSQAKEMLRLIGLSDFMYWLSHFTFCLITFLLQAIFFWYIFFINTPLTEHSSATLFVCAFLLFSCQAILYSMLITTIINRPMIAVIFAFIVWFLLLYQILKVTTKSTPWLIEMILLCFLPHGSFWTFCSLASEFEDSQTGLTFSTLFDSGSLGVNVTPLFVFIVGIVSLPPYLILIWYLDNVWPFQPGIPKPPLFFLELSYWFNEKRENRNQTSTSAATITSDECFFEKEPERLKATIKVRSVTKAFQGLLTMRKVAVDNVSLNIYENQLTVLLGHNGAGKTTLMNMITGMYRATSGSVFVDSFNVATQTQAARRRIGLCPQENFFFKELTVYQHFKLFAILKNYNTANVESEINRIIELLQLKDKQNCQAWKLSGGMKRKLSLGIALIGDSQILILDEPTSGLDPEARRLIWDLLISIRRTKTILLTTHYMEEADVLADWIVIVSQGSIVCSGSSLFLKKSLGTGYQLRVASTSGFNPKSFLQFLQEYIPSATIYSRDETEAIFAFNQKTNDKKFLTKLEPLFLDIEKQKKSLCIDSVGLCYTSLEDVFLRVGQDNLGKTKLNRTRQSSFSSRQSSVQSFQRSSESNVSGRNMSLTTRALFVSGSRLTRNQFEALLCKRFQFARRNWPMLLLQLAIPSLIIAVSMIKDKTADDITVKLDLRHWHGKNTKTFYVGPDSLGQTFRSLNKEKYGAHVNTSKPDSFSIDDWILDSIDSPSDYRHKHVYGLEIHENESLMPWFHAEQTHSLALSVHILYETLLRHFSGSDNSYIQASLRLFACRTIGNQTDDDTAADMQSMWTGWVFKCLILLPIAFPFLASVFTLAPLHEKVSKIKLLQMMTGVSPLVYWLANFVFDLLFFLCVILQMLAVILYLDTEGTWLAVEYGSFLFLLIFGFGFSSIAFAYLLSHFFSTPTTAYVCLLAAFFVFGLIGNLVISVMHLLSILIIPDLIKNVAVILNLLRLIPIFSMLFGYQKLYLLTTLKKLCGNIDPATLWFLCQMNRTIPQGDTFRSLIPIGCCASLCADSCYQNSTPIDFNDAGSGIELASLYLTGLLYLFFAIFFECFQWPTITFGRPKKPRYEDSDVAEERERIQQQVNRNNFPDLLSVHDLSKRFGWRYVVNRISFSVHNDECFGLLGVNGAGKTTTFSMLTGDLSPTYGNAYILQGKYSLRNNLRAFRQEIGYCPQFDAVLDKLTGRETLSLFGLLRGVPKDRLGRNVNALVGLVGLQQHVDRRIETYSGGTKRKLSIATSLIGTPALLLLDEPTCGVDPVARRKIWDLLSLIRMKFHSSIVLTSHSMDECEALCSRIAIMVNGTIRCLGSTQHLRSKYGQGYSITIRLKRQAKSPNYVNNLNEQLLSAIPSAKQKDFHQNLLQYHVTDPKEKWSNIFKNLNILDEMFDFEDYIVSDCSLESIFISFARQQNEDLLDHFEK